MKSINWISISLHAKFILLSILTIGMITYSNELKSFIGYYYLVAMVTIYLIHRDFKIIMK